MVYDLLMLCLLAMTTLRGKAKGIAWQLAGIATLVLCFLFAAPLSAAIAPHVPLKEPLNRWASMLGAYLVFSFGCFSVARGFRGFLESSRFEEFDKHLGALFGFIKGVTLCFVITFFAICLSDSAAGYVLQTKTGYVSAQIMQQIQPVLPAELQNVMRRAAGQPLLGQDPFTLGQDTGATGDALTDVGARSPLPGTTEQPYDLWQEPDDSLKSAPRFQGTTPPQSGLGLFPNPNSATAPRSRADFFGPSSGAPSGTSAPPAAGVFDQVQPLLSGSTGNGIADKALGVLKNLLPGSSQPTPTTPTPVAPMSGSLAPNPNLNSGSAATTQSPGFGDDELSFTPRNPQQFSPPSNSSPQPIGSTAPPSRINDDPFSSPANPGMAPTGRVGVTIPRADDTNPRRTDFGNDRPASTAPRPSDLANDDGFRAPRGNSVQDSNRTPTSAPRPDATPLRSQPMIGSRPALEDSRPSRFDDDDALPPARSNAFANPNTRPGTGARAPIPDSLPTRGNSISQTPPAPRVAPAGARLSRFDDDDLSRPAVDPRGGLDARRPLNSQTIAPAPASLSRLARPKDETRFDSTAPAPGLRSGGQGRPRTGPDGKPIDRTEEIRALTSGIAVLLSPPIQRPAREAEIQRAMQGLTQRTVSHVLRDWQADLLGNGRDPNPQTDVSTPLRERIALRLEYEQQKAGAGNSRQPGRSR